MMNDELSTLFVKELSSSAESAQETSTMAPVRTQIFPLQHCDEIWTYMFPITVHNMVSSVSCRDLVWPGMCSAVGAAVCSAFLYLSVSLLIHKTRQRFNLQLVKDLKHTGADAFNVRGSSHSRVWDINRWKKESH